MSKLVCKPIFPHGTKSLVTSQFYAMYKPSFHVTKSGIVIELSMLLHKKRVTWVKSFEDYARLLYHVIMKSTEPYRKPNRRGLRQQRF